MLQTVQKNPGITRRELADKLGVASPTVTRGVQNLHEDGYLILVKEGKYTRHYMPGNPYGNA
ncbi:winged helix-turn-helix transcriptional regulator [uncultured Methanospirillum sp.]|uniref:winged helix-turn-helix transcriptional regulator n=1 Tax=uncultured Methanospirillum sp. TaxID=262503 RepID=UPI0037484989